MAKEKSKYGGSPLHYGLANEAPGQAIPVVLVLRPVRPMRWVRGALLCCTYIGTNHEISG